MLLKNVLRPIIERISISSGQANEILDGIGNVKADNSTVSEALEKARGVVLGSWNTAPRDAMLDSAFDDFLFEIDAAIFQIENHKDDPDTW